MRGVKGTVVPIVIRALGVVTPKLGEMAPGTTSEICIQKSARLGAAKILLIPSDLFTFCLLWCLCRKGTTMHPAEVRSIVTEYVKKNELVDENNKNYVTINPTLCDCLLEKSEYQEVESLKWDDLFSRALARMQECYQVVFPGQAPITKKGHIEPVDISLASRGSNKKVTLIKNLEVYSLDPAVIASTLQHRVQASTVIHPVPGTKDKVLVQIQGNQVHQVGNLLLDHYQIPRKYIQGLDKAPKGSKKK